MADKRVLVIVVTFNGAKWMRDCLSSIPPGQPLIEGMVIDNGSTDGTVDFVKTHYPHIKVIENDRNLGFGAANNLGFQEALRRQFDYVYLLNQDAWIAPDDMLKLVEIADGHQDYGIISPLQVYKSGDKIDKNFADHINYAMINDFVAGNHVKNLYEINKGSMVQAAHWLLRTDAITMVGGFSPLFYHYGEDGDYCRRVRYWGMKIGIAPLIKGIHDRGQRPFDIKRELYIVTQGWKNRLSNPCQSVKRSYWDVMLAFLKQFPTFRLKLIPPFLKTILFPRKILKNRKLSMKAGAFLPNI